jgi:hypothetical protein
LAVKCLGDLLIDRGSRANVHGRGFLAIRKGRGIKHPAKRLILVRVDLFGVRTVQSLNRVMGDAGLPAKGIALGEQLATAALAVHKAAAPG